MLYEVITQRQACALDRHVGTRAHRDADIGSGERRRIVDAVADHADDVAFPMQIVDRRGLLVRLDLADTAIDADLFRITSYNVCYTKLLRAVHFLSTCMVGLGATFSAFWIMAANAWMQTPAGYEIVDGQLLVTSFREVIFNPAFPTHFTHMLMASYETSAFAVAGISAYFLLKGKYVPFYRRSLGIALVMAALLAPVQAFVGDLRGLNVV